MLDLSERLRVEQQRRDADRERERHAHEERLAREGGQAKDRFLAVQSHELRTPLTPAMFAAARLLTLPDLPPQALRLVTVLQRNLLLEARLVEDLLDVNRIARGKMTFDPRPVDVHDVIADAVEICRDSLNGKGLRLSVDLGARRSLVRADPVRLRQVFWNLLSNAIKFTDGSGEVTVRSTNVPSGSVVVDVIDTGVGIEPEQIARVFEPFEQVAEGQPKVPGLGLGLTICKGIVEAHSGQIRAFSSGSGAGSTFEVELPVLQDARGA
jgi:signal transduction histidine kinase